MLSKALAQLLPGAKALLKEVTGGKLFLSAQGIDVVLEQGGADLAQGGGHWPKSRS